MTEERNESRETYKLERMCSRMHKKGYRVVSKIAECIFLTRACVLPVYKGEEISVIVLASGA